MRKRCVVVSVVDRRELEWGEIGVSRVTIRWVMVTSPAVMAVGWQGDVETCSGPAAVVGVCR